MSTARMKRGCDAKQRKAELEAAISGLKITNLWKRKQEGRNITVLHAVGDTGSKYLTHQSLYSLQLSCSCGATAHFKNISELIHYYSRPLDMLKHVLSNTIFTAFNFHCCID